LTTSTDGRYKEIRISALSTLRCITVIEDYEKFSMDMIFGTWNVRGLYRAGSLMRVAKEIQKYN
jgi:hypothetical protein